GTLRGRDGWHPPPTGVRCGAPSGPRRTSTWTGARGTGARTGKRVYQVAAELLRGVFPMLPTPFDPSGALALEDLPPLVDFALGHGSAGVAALGLAGESWLMSEQERRATCEALIDAVAG